MCVASTACFEDSPSLFTLPASEYVFGQCEPKRCLGFSLRGFWVKIPTMIDFLLSPCLLSPCTVENESDAERVLFSYGFGTSVPSTSRRRMQQR